MRKFIVVLALLAGGLFFTNPKMDDFQSFVLIQLEKKLDENGTPNTAMGELLQKNLVNVAAGVAKNLTVRKDFFICSVYSLDMGSDNFSYIGVGTAFIPLQTEQPTDWLE